MPDRVNPGVLERHPYELVLSGWAIVAGLLLAAAAVIPFWEPAPSIEALPEPLLALIAVVLITGGSGVHAAFWSSLELGKALALERVSLGIMTAGWLGYVVAIAAYAPGRVMQWGIYIALCMATGFRWRALGIRTSVLRAVARAEENR